MFQNPSPIRPFLDTSYELFQKVFKNEWFSKSIPICCLAKSSPNESDQVNLSPSMQDGTRPERTCMGQKKCLFDWGKSKFFVKCEFTQMNRKGKKWWDAVCDESLSKKDGLNQMVNSNLMVAITAMLNTARWLFTCKLLPFRNVELWANESWNWGTFAKVKIYVSFLSITK